MIFHLKYHHVLLLNILKLAIHYSQMQEKKGAVAHNIYCIIHYIKIHYLL